MKIIWILNGIIPKAASLFNIKNALRLSWVEAILPQAASEENLVICGPVSGTKGMLRQEKDGTVYYGVPTKNQYKYNKKMQRYFCEIFEQEKPDVIHIWGTEFPHTLSAAEAVEKLNLADISVISIQGLVSVCERHYMSGVPNWVKYLMVPKNFVRGYNLYLTQKAFQKRGQYEKSALCKVKHVIGRTDWDFACTKLINNKLVYHKNNESMRAVFYSAKWDHAQSETHRIFLSQGSSPVKGTHRALEALKILKELYPDVCLYLTGRDVMGKLSLEQKLRIDPYEWYLRWLIRKWELQNHVFFLGSLSAEQMCEQYLRAQVSVLPSSIENSPNSLGEAMLVGTPCVVADVGGVRSMADSDEVFFYPHDEPYMLVYYIAKVFEFDEEVLTASLKASEHARQTHDVKKNVQELFEIYKKITSEK